MRRIRVLVVDDSVVVRRLMSQLLEADPVLEIAATAANGRIALAKIPQAAPDIVVLDVDMPVMDGLETLDEIRRLYPSLPVLMFSALTERGADATLEALFRGAVDYVTKPTHTGSADRAAQAIRDEVIPKIKALRARMVTTDAAAPAGSAAVLRPRRRKGPVEVVVLAASTGGPAALEAVLKHLPRPVPVPVLVVQHMPPIFTTYLAQQLSVKCGHEVREVTGDVRPGAGAVWVAPGGRHMVAEADEDGPLLRVTDDPPVNSCRPSADPLLVSVARVWGAGALAVVLTGMGRDGLRGCEEIREAGGQVLVQDQATSVVWGMPGFIVAAGLANDVLPLPEIAGEIGARLGPRTPERAGTGR